MTEEQLNEIKASLELVVKQTVNGKIDSLNIILNKHIKADDIWKAENNIKWENAQPIINAGKNLTGWGKITAAIVIMIATIVGIITGLMTIFRVK